MLKNLLKRFRKTDEEIEFTYRVKEYRNIAIRIATKLKENYKEFDEIDFWFNPDGLEENSKILFILIIVKEYKLQNSYCYHTEDELYKLCSIEADNFFNKVEEIKKNIYINE